MIKAPPVAVTAENGQADAAKIEDETRAKGESALRRLLADSDGRYFLKWLMERTDLEGPSGSERREGERGVGRDFKASCDSLGQGVYAGLVAEMTAERAAAEARRAKALAAP